MIRKYLIADYVIELNFDWDAELEKKLSSYKSDTLCQSDLYVDIIKTDDEIKIRKNNLVKISEIAYFYSEDNTDVLFYYDTNISKTIAKIEFSKEYNSAKVILYNLKKMHGVDDTTFMFNIVGTLIHYFVQMNGGYVFHSSSICHNGFGVAFSAKSGTGKSTHTNLWLQNYPGTYLLNDDTPIIRLGQDNNFYLCGTPWAGTTGININKVVPLKALVFLERDKVNSITPLTPQEAIANFFEAIKSPLTDDMFGRVLDTLNILLKKVPVYKLKCNMGPDAARVANDCIFNIK